MTETIAYLRRGNVGERELAIILEQLRLMHAECVRHGAFSERKVRAKIEACLDNGAIAIAIEDSEIVGSMGLLIDEWWYSDDKILSEHWVYIHPDHRRSRHARNLITAAKVAAKMIGMPLVAGITTNGRTEGKCRLYRRLLEPIGQIFIGEAA